MKICTKCNISFSLDNFRKDKTKKDGYYPSCKDCHRKRLKQRKFGTYESPKKIHSMTKTRFYRIYRSILDRCNYPSNCAYNRYGGKGIVCEWKTFEEFKKDMYKSYLEHERIYGTKETTIDRKINDSNYNKNNCRWATKQIQANNRKIVHKFLYKGTFKTITELSNIIGIDRKTLYARLITYEMPFKKALQKNIFTRI